MITRKYSLGEQDFASIRKAGKVYVDKTIYALHLIETSKSNFLAKTRFVRSTLESMFLGKKERSEGLYSYDKWNLRNIRL